MHPSRESLTGSPSLGRWRSTFHVAQKLKCRVSSSSSRSTIRTVRLFCTALTILITLFLDLEISFLSKDSGNRNTIQAFKKLTVSRNEYWASWIPISVVIAGVYELFKDHLRRKRPLEENINPHLIKIPERAIDTYLRLTKAKITRETPSEEIPAALHIRTYFKLYEEQEELAQIDRKLRYASWILIFGAKLRFVLLG